MSWKRLWNGMWDFGAPETAEDFALQFIGQGLIIVLAVGGFVLYCLYVDWRFRNEDLHEEDET